MTSDPYAGWALVVVDAQQGFDDPAWGTRNNPDCDANIAALVGEWSTRGRPLVYVHHDSAEDGSLLAPGTPGNALRPYLDAAEPDLVVAKDVNSAFHGTPDLHAWL
jgi:nicotinamidase-related amidase